MAETDGKDQQGSVECDPALLSILVCPVCHRTVEQRGAALVCAQCGRRYPIKNGIPVMLVDAALPPDQNTPDPG